MTFSCRTSFITMPNILHGSTALRCVLAPSTNHLRYFAAPLRPILFPAHTFATMESMSSHATADFCTELGGSLLRHGIRGQEGSSLFCTVSARWICFLPGRPLRLMLFPQAPPASSFLLPFVHTLLDACVANLILLCFRPSHQLEFGQVFSEACPPALLFPVSTCLHQVSTGAPERLSGVK